MKCPMLTMYAMSFEPPGRFKDRDCLKEECAWWDREFERCSVRGISSELVDICARLQAISNKMPKDLAPRG